MLHRTLYDASRRARWVLVIVAVVAKAVAACSAGAEQASVAVPGKLTYSPVSKKPESAMLGTFEDKRAGSRVYTHFLNQSNTSPGPCISQRPSQRPREADSRREHPVAGLYLSKKSARLGCGAATPNTGE